jgi:hypothetical protein
VPADFLAQLLDLVGGAGGGSIALAHGGFRSYPSSRMPPTKRTRRAAKAGEPTVPGPKRMSKIHVAPAASAIEILSALGVPLRMRRAALLRLKRSLLHRTDDAKEIRKIEAAFSAHPLGPAGKHPKAPKRSTMAKHVA